MTREHVAAASKLNRAGDFSALRTVRVALLNTLPYDHWNLPLIRIHKSGCSVLIFYFSFQFEKAATGSKGDLPTWAEEACISQSPIRESSPFFHFKDSTALLFFRMVTCVPCLAARQ